MTLNEVMKETADAIREKTGKSEKIAPINFAEEIKSISTGGGESGGVGWELTYYKIVDANEQMMQGLFLYGCINIVNCAIKSSNKVIANAGTFLAFTAINDGRSNEILAIVSAKLPILVDGEYKPISLKEFFVGTGLWDATSPMLLEITEAEYYNLE